MNPTTPSLFVMFLRIKGKAGHGGAGDAIHNPCVLEPPGLISTLPDPAAARRRFRHRLSHSVPTAHNRRRAALLRPRHARVFQATDAPGMGPLSAMPSADVWISWGDLSDYLTATQATVRESLFLALNVLHTGARLRGCRDNIH
ncbi:hypothetical protein GQ55_8G229200 [Panicum hallii var. hallii]|uniref:Uncharacterized protein n=1 Tax=Panicum hallii var. hallii TaxID=1504633 RepID=A0A2T7CQ85_9POAL|nr:hypothetical protein GQ55_8G229200 [Panicum hallii var. hallii]PUZ45501.1 hypothetical protein GQ55_8G229200 [Panicum hallii var. hallii]PUZ45502.1 hypothetical protein GQ55_8G229200 [Panicum hallii var. hallii]PUZ45503.1 hypothetical protein GQ55_8G229200 [Panicum hallii var. hallii]PUZ45504.1 hypothetical protein GQ55_8G229200 [Panicum hallii var. hallii]